MKRLIHHVKRHSKIVHEHIKKHHKHYIFGAISAALIYKTLALILTTAAVTPMGHSFASGEIDTGIVDNGIEVSGEFFVNNDDSTTTGLNVILNNNINGATHMRFGNTESDKNIAAWDTYTENKIWTLDDNGAGIKTVYADFSGDINILSLEDTIEYVIPLENTLIIDTGIVDTGIVFISDTTINTFDFTDINNANLNTEYFTNTHVISGINTGTTISISGGNYKINSSNRTSNNGIINSGDSILVSTFSKNDYNTQKVVEILIGDVSINWIITTQNANITCDSSDINVISPISGNILKGKFNIVRSHNNTNCQNDEFIIKLRDANTQYITIGTSSYSNTTLNFDSSLLYSGFYNITGLNASGNVVINYTGEYDGFNTKYFSGHKIVILNSDLDTIYEGGYFTIDNLSPKITNIQVNASNKTGGYVGLDSIITLSFDSSEKLSSGSKVMILGKYALLESNLNNHYFYTLDLSGDNNEGHIIYNIEFQDLALNSGYSEGSDNSIIFDKTIPTVENLRFTNTGDNINILVNINENSQIKFIYNLSGSNTGGIYESNYLTSHIYSFTGILANTEYNYTISIQDIAKNITYMGGTFILSGNNIVFSNKIIKSGDMIVDVGFKQKVNTGSLIVATSANTFKTEIEKFNICKESLENMSSLKVPVRKYKVQLEMPEFETNYVKKLVSAFSIVLFERIDKAGLDEPEILDIAAEFNNFLVILKLVRDDGNECEQNLSNYYMSKFRKSLIEYNLTEN